MNKSTENTKGIVLAGGNGTRLYPITQGISKQLLPIYDKPMIYYPLSVLMMAGIQDILLISTPHDLPYFERLLGDGSRFGINLNYMIQSNPDGIAQAFILAEKFIGSSPASLILGDNIFYGNTLQKTLKNICTKENATIFAYHVNNPNRYGVIEFDANFNAISIEEKPSKAKSNYAVTGLYFYDNDVIQIAKSLKPSARGELEITDVSLVYLQNKKLNVQIINQQDTWLDTGTYDSLLEASNFVAMTQKRQDLMVGCPEEIAYKNGWLNKQALIKSIEPLCKTKYAEYLLNMLKND